MVLKSSQYNLHSTVCFAKYFTMYTLTYLICTAYVTVYKIHFTLYTADCIYYKLDGVGPVDSRPSTD